MVRAPFFWGRAFFVVFTKGYRCSKLARRYRSVQRFGFFTVKCDALGQEQTLHHLLYRDPCLWADTPTGAFSRLW